MGEGRVGVMFIPVFLPLDGGGIQGMFSQGMVIIKKGAGF